jgi:hypothetical protein
MDAATRYNNRYKAIIDAAQGAVINLAELEEWISSAGHSEEIPLKNIREREGWPFFHRLTHLISIEWVDRLPDSEVPAQLRQHAMLLAGRVVTDLKAATVLTSLSRALNEKKLLVALHEAKLDQLILGAVYDGELRLYREHGRNRQEMDFAQAKAEYDADPRAGARTEAIDYQKLRMPRPDAGQGASVEATTRTSLTPFLELETWTPLEGALLVCGVIPPANCHAIPHGAMSLGGVLLMPTDDPFHDARRVLQIWNSQMSPPEKVRPAEFVAWCRSKAINTDWLREVPATVAEPMHDVRPPAHLALIRQVEKPIKREAEQEQVILAAIAQMGMDHGNLPPYLNGKPSVKIDIEVAVQKLRPDLFVKGSSVFGGAWERLRRVGKVVWGK